MTWKEERDALIAQTMAFVQSVTGKPADFAQFELPAVPKGTPITPQQAVTARGGPAVAEPTGDGTASDQPAVADARHSEPNPAPAKVVTERFTSIAAQLDLQRDMQAEIRARVARFRAHQERFNRERQEYFSATLARLKASAAGMSMPED